MSEAQPGRSAPSRPRDLAFLGAVLLGLQILGALAAIVIGGWLVYAVTTAEEAPGGVAAAGAVIALLGIWLIVRTVRGRG